MLTWSTNCVISSNEAADQEKAFAIIDIKFYTSFVNLSSQDNPKLLQQLTSEFKWITFCNKFQLRVSAQTRNQYVDYLIDPRFQVVDTLFCIFFTKNCFHKECKSNVNLFCFIITSA